MKELDTYSCVESDDNASRAAHRTTHTVFTDFGSVAHHSTHSARYAISLPTSVGLTFQSSFSQLGLVITSHSPSPTVHLALQHLPRPLCTMSSLSSSTTVYVISGTSRGIGLGFVEQLVSLSDTFIYAGARDVNRADKLQQLAKQHSNVRVVKLSAESDEDHAALRKQVEAEAGRVDVLIPNAAIAFYEKTGEISLDNMRSQFEVNIFGPLRLFQSLLPLLARSSNPRFIPISSVTGSITLQPNLAMMPVAAYGASKAALNLLVTRVHVEHTNLTAFIVHPGHTAYHSRIHFGGVNHAHTAPTHHSQSLTHFRTHAMCVVSSGHVQSDAGNHGAHLAGMEKAPTTIEDSCRRVLQFVFEAKRDTHGGKFFNADNGTEMPW